MPTSLVLSTRVLPRAIMPVAVRQPVLAAQDPVGRVADAVARGVAQRGLGGLHAQLEHRPHAAPELPVARRVGAELVALEEERKARLRDLDAAELDAARRLALAGGLPPVAGRGGAAAAARVEEVPDELAPRPRVRARDRDAEAARPAREHALRAAPGEGLDHRLRDLLRAVIGGQRHRRGRVGPDHRALPSPSRSPGGTCPRSSGSAGRSGRRAPCAPRTWCWGRRS